LEEAYEVTAEEIIQAMSQRGMRITDQRRTLANLFAQTEGYLMPKDVYEHLICIQCEKTIPFVYCPMDGVTGLPKQFAAVKHKFEIYGYCKDCQA
jgi:Fur family zinc uptake transcriptional regulator